MKRLFKNYKFLLFLACILLSLFAIAFNGLQFGIDFKGGTLFQIHLAEKPTPQQLSTITTILSQRIDSFGLKDSSVKSFGEDFVIAQIAETDPAKVQQIETIIKTQGRFEAILDQQVLFTGSDLLQIVKDPSQGYGITKGTPQNPDPTSQFVSWTLPFKLNQEAAVRFSKGIFHKCTQVSLGQYDCALTYFFIDRPINGVLVLPKTVYGNDQQALLIGNQQEDITEQTDIVELLSESSVPFFTIDQNGLTDAQKQEIETLSLTKTEAIVHPEVSSEIKQFLTLQGYKIKELEVPSGIPWVWRATGAKQTIALTPSITGFDPFIADIANAQIYSDLVITGTATNFDDAKKKLSDLTIILETGSLPIPIDDVSNESISPFLGKEFLDAAIIMGLISLLMVALILFLRYKNIKIAIPIIVTGISEVVMILGVSSILKINLDLASVAGILAVIGTGVDHQIVITDELMHGQHTAVAETLNSRTKKAFFIIFAAALSTIATMLPIIFFGLGLGKLLGFAVTTIVGVLIGVLITRPVFAEMAKIVIEK